MKRKVLPGTHEFGSEGIGYVWRYFDRFFVTAIIFFGYSSFLTFFTSEVRLFGFPGLHLLHTLYLNAYHLFLTGISVFPALALSFLY